MKKIVGLSQCMVFSMLISVASLLQANDEPEIFEMDSYKDAMDLFEEIGYTKASWQTGAHEVHRVYLQNMASRWRGKYAPEIEISLKKEIFLRALAPLILRSNELILEDRQRMLSLVETGAGADAWLRELALRYKVIESMNGALDENMLIELRSRVDAVPNSLALAQTIEESGWGTSRFADQGNAMFGQWTWGEKAIKPEQQRAGKGNYGIASFDSPQESVSGYMHNINTHRAYAPLRAKRAEIRAAGKEPTGADLVPTLISYSERGQHYIDTLNAIMRQNRLHEADDAVLVGRVILMVPVGEGAD